eukprot:Skav221982  [mRNA]  locus=scaffold195:1145316:1145828:- [translate_table: standard]
MAERYAFIQVNAPEGAALPELDGDGNREQAGGGDLCNMTLHLQRMKVSAGPVCRLKKLSSVLIVTL